MKIDIKKQQYFALAVKCFIEGEEVTNRCYYADTRKGIVGLYIYDENGRCTLDSPGKNVNKEQRHGKVKLVINYKRLVKNIIGWYLHLPSRYFHKIRWWLKCRFLQEYKS